MNDTKWIDVITRELASITEPTERSLINMVILDIVRRFKNDEFKNMDGKEILKMFGIEGGFKDWSALNL